MGEDEHTFVSLKKKKGINPKGQLVLVVYDIVNGVLRIIRISSNSPQNRPGLKMFLWSHDENRFDLSYFTLG